MEEKARIELTFWPKDRQVVSADRIRQILYDESRYSDVVRSLRIFSDDHVAFSKTVPRDFLGSGGARVKGHTLCQAAVPVHIQVVAQFHWQFARYEMLVDITGNDGCYVVEH